MKSFEHSTHARNDIKLRRLKKKYGLEGIGAWWIMVEVIGDVVVPSELILPTVTTAKTGKSGMIFLSGAKIWFHNGTNVVIVTSG